MDLVGHAMTDAETVTDLLRASLAAHQAALEARQQRDPATASLQLQIAYDLRLQAHRLDPDHTAPAWQAEDRKTPRGRDTHSELLAFYRSQLGYPVEESSHA
jgi:hypothetical protein